MAQILAKRIREGERKVAKASAARSAAASWATCFEFTLTFTVKVSLAWYVLIFPVQRKTSGSKIILL